LQELIAIRANLNASAFWLAALRLHRLVGKANFNPNQPRVPRGHREGGRWTREGDPHTPSSRPNLEFDEEGNPKLPEKRPDLPQVRNSLSKQLAKWIFEQTPAVETALAIVAASRWLYENSPAILSYLDSPKTLGELQRAALQNPKAPPGYEKHHIVEREAARSAGFREVLVEGWENIVLIPTYRHHEITSWFMTLNKDYDGLSPREYLRGKSWVERYRVGLKALIIFGVLKR
jgi:hypothetical protein